MELTVKLRLQTKNKLQIIGGTYTEVCLFPRWEQIYGSGLRATIALSNFGTKLEFYTYGNSKIIDYINLIEKSFKFKSFIVKNNSKYYFNYLHTLSRPYLQKKEFKSPFKKKPLKLSNVILYGMMEEIPKFTANNVVYDPQSSHPKYFSELGCTATNLIVILNEFEANQLLNGISIKKINKFFNLHINCKCIIIKRGLKGAVVYIPNKKPQKIPVYHTNKSWLIGSGDVFTAIFGFYWLILKKSILVSAHIASKYVAYYCETKMLPLPNITLLNNFISTKSALTISDRKKGMVYIAGPIFSLSNIWMVNEIKSLLEHYTKVFSPFHDVGLGTAKEVVDKDIEAIKTSNIIFGILDEFDPGTVFEIGFAKALSKKVIIYCANLNTHNLTMFEGTNCFLYDDIGSAIYKTIWLLHN